MKSTIKSNKHKKASKDEKIVPAKTNKISKTDISKVMPELTPEHKEENGIKSLEDMEKIILEKYEHKPEIVKEIETASLEKTPESMFHKETKARHSSDDKTKVEAILFAVGKYLEEETIASLCEIDKKHVKKALEELKKDYDSRDTALMIIQEGNSWKINVRERFLSLVRKIVSDTELSKSVMETLAVIAWKTPVYQNQIVKIRGNKCYDHIEELLTAGFITKDKKGRSYILKTTEKFYNYFDIDQKNLSTIMNEAKVSQVQTKLTEEIEKPPEQPYSREKLLHALDTIETKKIVLTEEDKVAQKEFLDKMHSKIEDSAKRTDGIISEIPRPMHEQPAVAEDVPAPLEGDAVVEKGDEIVIDTGTENGAHHFQKPDEQLPQKIKQLTKKQLEKKFKEELQKVKEKKQN